MYLYLFVYVFLNSFFSHVPYVSFSSPFTLLSINWTFPPYEPGCAHGLFLLKGLVFFPATVTCSGLKRPGTILIVSDALSIKTD